MYTEVTDSCVIITWEKRVVNNIGNAPISVLSWYLQNWCPLWETNILNHKQFYQMEPLPNYFTADIKITNNALSWKRCWILYPNVRILQKNKIVKHTPKPIFKIQTMANEHHSLCFIISFELINQSNSVIIFPLHFPMQICFYVT